MKKYRQERINTTIVIIFYYYLIRLIYESRVYVTFNNNLGCGKMGKVFIYLNMIMKIYYFLINRFFFSLEKKNAWTEKKSPCRINMKPSPPYT